MTTADKLRAAVERFNAAHPVGTPVWAWPFTRGDKLGFETRTRTEAMVLSGHSAVVWVEDHPGCIALSHIKAIELADLEEADDDR